MILLAALVYLLVGGFSTGMAFALLKERPDPVLVCLAVAVAPVTLIYVIGHLAFLAGRKFTASFME